MATLPITIELLIKDISSPHISYDEANEIINNFAERNKTYVVRDKNTITIRGLHNKYVLLMQRTKAGWRVIANPKKVFVYDHPLWKRVILLEDSAKSYPSWDVTVDEYKGPNPIK